MAIKFLSGVNIDSNTLFVDDANNRVGIGTNSPSRQLELVGSDAYIQLTRSSTSTQATLGFNTGATNDWLIRTGDGSTSNLQFYSYGTSSYVMTIARSSGNVGIGTTSPSYKLEVNGSFGTVTSGIYLEYNSGILYHAGGSGNYYQYISGANYLLSNRTATGALVFSTVDIERMRITSAGNVGIGTTAPPSHLSVVGNIESIITVSTATVNYLKLGTYYAGQWGSYVGAGSNYSSTLDTDLRLGVSSGGTATEVIRITSSGNVGIGTTSPGERLELAGSNVMLKINASTDTFAQLGYYENGTLKWNAYNNYANDNYQVGNSGGTYFAITPSGNVGIGTTSPSYKASIVAANGNYWNGTAFTGIPLAISIENSEPGGYDPVLIYNQADSGGTLKNSGAIGMVGTGPWTAGNNALQVSDMYFLVRNSSGGISERLRIKSTGAAQLKAYGSGSFTGTVAYNLAVDSSGNIIETAGGVVDGSGTANYVSKWSDANTLTNSLLYDNGSTISIGLGSTTPSYTNAYGYPQFAIESNAFASSHVFTHNDTNGNYSFFALGKSKGTAAAPTIVENSETIGDFQFWAYDGAAYRNTAFIRNQIDGEPGAGDVPGRLVFGTTNDGSSAASEKMRITSAGNVGIGTTAPSAKLDVNGDINLTNYGSLTGGNSSNRMAIIKGTGASGNIEIGGLNNSDVIILTHVNERMRITSAGNVGIGTTSPGAKLDIYGASPTTVYESQLRIYGSETTGNQDTGGAIAFSGHDGVAGRTFGFIRSMKENSAAGNYAGYMSFGTRANGSDLAEKMRITAAGNVGIGVTSTSAKLESYQSAVWDGSNYAIKANHYSTFNGIRINGQDQERDIYQENTSYGIGIATSGAQPIKFLISNSSEIMRVAGNGNVGIGTTSPSNKLTIVSSAQNSGLSILDFNGAAGWGGGINLGVSGLSLETQGKIYTSLTNSGPGTVAGDMRFQTANSGALSDKMTITAAGNVGIGTTAPGAKLHVDGGNAIFNNGSADTILAIETDAAGLYDPIFQMGSGQNTIASEGFEIWYANNVGDVHLSTTYNDAAASIRFHTATGASKSTSNERMIITGAGNVGIGTTSPSSLLDVYNGSGWGAVDIDGISGGEIRLQKNGTTYGNLYASDNSSTAFVINAAQVTDLILQTNSSERLRITSAGNVGIGTTSPAVKFVVSNAGASGFEVDPTGGVGGGPVLQAYNRSTSAYMAQSYYALSHTFNVGSGGSTRAVDITAAGNVGIGTTSPASRLQSNTSSTYNSATPSGAIIASNLSGGNAIIDIGVDASYLGYIQSRNILNTTAYNLLLNPIGGNVGIGTTSPGKKLDILQSSDSSYAINIGNSARYTYIGYSDTYQLDFGATGTNDNVRYGVFSVGGGVATFHTNGSERMRITSAGDVGIGTTSPAAKLHVYTPSSGSAIVVGRATGNSSIKASADANGGYLSLDSTGGATIINHYAADDVWLVTGGGNLGIGTSGPTQRVHVNGNVRVTGAYYDSNNEAGTSGQVLSSTGSGTDWVSLSEITGVDGTGTANYVAKWSDTDTITNSQVFDNGTNVGINNASPKTKLDVNGAIGFGSKSMSMTDTFAAALTINMNDHNGCYVKITAFGDWSNHSTIAYLGEFFIQASAGSYNEPGIIIRQVDNTGGGDDIQAQIVDPAGTGTRDFVIQLKATSASNTPFTAYLQYEVRGLYNSVS